MALIEHDEEQLRRLLGCGGAAIPLKVIELYERVQRFTHRVRLGPMSLETLALICLMAKADDPKADLNPWASIHEGTPIVHLPPGGQRKEGIFKGIAEGGLLMVHLNGDGTSIEVPQAECKAKG